MKKEDRKVIASRIEYELAKGTHTYSPCRKCDKLARTIYCWRCYLDMLVEGKILE